VCARSELCGCGSRVGVGPCPLLIYTGQRAEGARDAARRRLCAVCCAHIFYLRSCNRAAVVRSTAA